MYLDPSFGGMLLQILVAVIAGGGAMLYGMRRKLKSMSRKEDENPAKTAAPASTEGVIDMLENEGGDK